MCSSGHSGELPIMYTYACMHTMDIMLFKYKYLASFYEADAYFYQHLGISETCFFLKMEFVHDCGI